MFTHTAWASYSVYQPPGVEKSIRSDQCACLRSKEWSTRDTRPRTIPSLSGPVSLVGSPVQAVVKLCQSFGALTRGRGTTPRSPCIGSVASLRCQEFQLGTTMPTYTHGAEIQQRKSTHPFNLEELNKEDLQKDKREMTK